MSDERRKHPGGRPTKYKADTMPGLAYQALCEGGTLAHVAVALDVDEHTVNHWTQKHPEFSTAIKNGLAQAKILWIDKKVSEMPPGCWVFSMKNIFDWKDKSETEVSGSAFMLVQNLAGKPKDEAGL